MNMTVCLKIVMIFEILILAVVPYSTGLSYNLPKFCPNATWDPNGTTFADNSTVNQRPFKIFIDRSNTVYVSIEDMNEVQVWSEGSIHPTRTLIGSLNAPNGIFVTSNGDIYVDNGNNQRIDKWTMNSNDSTYAVDVPWKCVGLFLDINLNIYCSIDVMHQVLKRTWLGGANLTTIVAGNGSAGATSDLLSNPNGIFVDTNFNLYVADWFNDRIQMFLPGQLNATTVAGNGAPGTITLNGPSDVILDADNYLYIVDRTFGRIIGSGPTGFRCIVGCFATGGVTADQLNFPRSLSFDSYGNLFVTDTDNHRVQKFTLITGLCDENLTTVYTTEIPMTSVTMIPPDVSYNLPKFCSNASWNPNATTFADNMTVGQSPFDIFISINNTMYVTIQDMNQVQIWSEGSMNPTRTISGNLDAPKGLFATINGDIYIDNGNNQRIDKWSINSNNTVMVTDITRQCIGLFLDINYNIYCSTNGLHLVLKKSFLNGTNISTIVGGNGSAGSTSNLLWNPNGIFVDTNFNLYVADWGNDRIQLFLSGQLNAITVVGNGAPGTITLSGPSDVILDGSNYLYIVDRSRSRIVGSGPNGFQCIVGCSGSSGSTADKLFYPQSLSFDSYGNLFVTDTSNNRIQKFTLLTGSCFEYSTNVQDTTVSTPASMTTNVDTIERRDCSLPIITLIPSNSSLTTPLQFRRSQDFYISSIIQLNCTLSLSIITKWTIVNCTSVCSSSEIQNYSFIDTTFNELFIPARSLPYGVYQLKLTVTMVAVPVLNSSASIYVKITQSGVTANLVQYGTSLITSSPTKDLIFNPGQYSIDPDSDTFNATNWIYNYYCQLYDLDHLINYGPLLPIEQSNHSCFSYRSNNNSVYWLYNSTVAPQSSLRILAGALALNQTYRFMVYMINRQNPNTQATGYVLVKIENTEPEMIVVACVISTMCAPNLEYQFINPTTQVALFSVCLGNCLSLINITWNIYQGSMNSSTYKIEWIPFIQLNSSIDNRFFGINTSNFTATIELFTENPKIFYWSFEVTYSFTSEKSSSALNFLINQPPRNGSCSVNPQNGTINTWFTIYCSNWTDEDGLKDYSFYVWTKDPSEQMIIGTSSQSNFQLRLPAGNNNASLVHIIVYIRDMLNAVTKYYLEPVVVTPDIDDILTLINILQQSDIELINQNPIIQLLSTGTQNTIVQVLTALSQVLNDMNNQNIDNAISNGIPAASISVSSLGSTSPSLSLTPFNSTAFVGYNNVLKIQANVRDYLIKYLSNLPISSPESVELQASTLSQFTDSTNQLTRTTSMQAANKCHQLSITLQSMAKTLSYEDVQTAAISIAECANNVLTAVNEPLQERGSVLDRDFTRANTFPDDYDTDLEFIWSNPNLFADGNDFSWNAIQKGRNTYYQKQLAFTIGTQVMDTFSSISNALKIHLNIGQNKIINTSSVFFSMEVLSIQSLSNKFIQLSSNAYIRFPSNFNSINNNNNTVITLRSIMQPLATAGNSRLLANTNLSTAISLSLLDQYNNDISFHANITNPIEILIPRDINTIIPSMTIQNTSSINNSNRSFSLYYVNITRYDNLTISFHLEMRPFNINVAYLLIYKFDGIPQLNKQIDGWTLFCPNYLTNNSLYTYMISNERISSHQSIIIGLRELNTTNMNDYCSNTSKIPILSDQPFNFSSNYELRMYISGCYYLDSNNNWQSDGLIVGPLTNHYQTQCYATQPKTYAAGFYVLPSPINWDYVFANADFTQNKNLYITVISVTVVYIILIIYARLQDKKDGQKLGITSLPDNRTNDHYFYQITVYTGHRKNAGTKSKVYFILNGDYDETNVRILTDPDREILQLGGIDSFIMAVPRPLGPLNYIHIWHDNSGSGSSADWFLKYILVRNLQTLERSYFLCQRWFAIDKDDGAIERILPIRDKLEQEEFRTIVSKRTGYFMSEKHLWFSIFLKPPSNKFTRIQRCTCCFVLLLFDMLLNILYYNQLKELQTISDSHQYGLSLGAFYISFEQIVIGIIVGIFSMFLDLLVVQLFRRIGSRQQQISPLRQTLETITNQKLQSVKVRRQKRKLTFPWWFIFVGYILSLFLVSISILFIFARGIEFGESKTQKWLTSVISGFIASIFIIEPIKIVSLAVIFTFIMRTANHNDDNHEVEEYFNDDIILPHNEQFHHHHQIKRKSPLMCRLRTRNNRLNETELTLARNIRRKERKMWSILQEIGTYICFVWLLFLISYYNHNQNSFLQVKHLRNFFLNDDFTKIVTINDYWNWLEQSFVSNIRAQQWYNNNPPRNLSGFINDKSNRLIGWVTMRQLRVKSNSCLRHTFARLMNITCTADYSFSTEETRSFQAGWLNQSLKTSNSSIDKAFIYRSSKELDTYIYLGNYAMYNSGGYVYEFRGRLSDLRNNLSGLHRSKWIDKQTRAIIIQLNLYNPNIAMFTSVTFLFEFLSTGGIYSTIHIQPINLQNFLSSYHLLIIILYMIFIIYFLIIEIRLIFHLKSSYFTRLKSYIELSIIISSWISIGIYIWRYHETKRIGNLFKKTHGFVSINLQQIVYINNLFNYLLSYCCFFGTLKLLEFCRFNRHLSIFHDTLQLIFKEILWFMLTFLIIFLSFIFLFYLLFVSNISTCSTLLHTCQMLFEMLLFKFNTKDLYEYYPILGPVCFTIYIIFVVFICMNMFISIIIQNFRIIRRNVQMISNDDHYMFQFMAKKFLCWTGISKPNEFERQEERDIIMRSKYYDPIEYFPELIERILNIVSRLYIKPAKGNVPTIIITSESN